jgi:preprotein translocase subunit SecG
VVIVFEVLLVITSLLMILLVLLHKGRGGGLSDMFGGGVSSGLVWFACVVGLGLLLKTGN